MKPVLVVEDSKLFSTILSQKINAELHVPVHTAASFREARQLIEKEQAQFSIALLDLTLPDSTGEAIVDYVVSKHIPAVVFTGDYSEGTQRMVWSKKVVDYVLKEGPHSIDYIVSLVRRLDRNRNVKVMVVEDSAVQRKHARHLFEVHQYQVLEARNGEEALRILTPTRTSNWF